MANSKQPEIMKSARGFVRKKKTVTNPKEGDAKKYAGWRRSSPITAKEAVLAATGYFRDVTANAGAVTVEEIELTDDGKYWLVTLGVVAPILNPHPLAALVPQAEVAYKVFKVDAKTGLVKSMKLRHVG